MKELTKYQCEICRKLYDNKNDAIACESKGVPELYPIGMIFMYPNIKDIEIIFAVIKQNFGCYDGGHHHSYLTWACRDRKKKNGLNYSDNVGGEEFCGIDSWSKIIPPNKNIPAYQRMLDALEKAKIKPINYKN